MTPSQPWLRPCAIPLLAIGALFGCVPDPSSAPTDAGPDQQADAGPFVGADPNARVGAFQVRLVAPTETSAGFTSVVGRVQDGPSPQAIIWETDSTVGECRLSLPRVPFCATSCGGDAVCVEDDTCAPYASAHDVGTVTGSGFSSPFEMEAVGGGYQLPASVDLPFPAFAAGDPLGLSAAGSGFAPPFVLSTSGIAPLALLDDGYPLAADTPLVVTWTPAVTSGASQIHLKLDISHHGGTRGMIECDGADDGALEIGGALVTDLLALGVAGFPTVVVSRASTGEVAIPAGRVELAVSSSVEREVRIDGLVSCNSDVDCSDGATCAADLVCR